MSLILSGTDGLSDVDGSAATPAIRGTDANTGIFFGTDIIGFSEGGVEAARFDSSGNFGLGVTPSVQYSGIKSLQVGSTTNLFDNGASTKFYHNAYTAAAGDETYLTTGYAQGYLMASNGQHQWYTAASGTAGTTFSFTQAMTLDASGRLGIGPTTPANVLDVSGASGSLARFKSTGNYSTVIADNTSTTGGGAFAFYKQGGQIGIIGVDGAILGTTSTDVSFFAETGSSLKFYTNGSASVKAMIDTSGNLLVGKTGLNALVGTSIDANTSTGQGIRVVSSSTTTSADGFQMYSTGAAAYRFYVSFNGTISATNTTISSLSDQRHKENIRNLNVGLAEVMALKPRLFDWKEGKGADTKNARGFIAQEFEEVFPDLIDEWKDPAPEGEEPYKSVRQDLIPVLVKAIQEQQALITQLTARISALESA